MNEHVTYAGSLVSIVCKQVVKGEKIETFECAERAPGVRMIVVDQDEKICITNEWRHELNNGQGGYDFRLPGGKVVDTFEEYSALKKKGPDALFVAAQEAVTREASEEVGIIPQQIDFVRISHCGATMRWDLYYFLVPVFEMKPSGQNLGRNEDISVGRYSREEVLSLCLAGEISEDRSVAVLFQWLAS